MIDPSQALQAARAQELLAKSRVTYLQRTLDDIKARKATEETQKRRQLKAAEYRAERGRVLSRGIKASHVPPATAGEVRMVSELLNLRGLT